MKKAVLVGLGLVFSASVWAGNYECINQIQKISSEPKLLQLTEWSARHVADFHGDRIQEVEKVFNAHLLQACVQSGAQMQGVSVHFNVRAKVADRKSQIYACLAKYRRFHRLGTEEWDRWTVVRARCKKATTGAASVEWDYVPRDNSGGIDFGAGDAYDPHFYDRTPSYGPDDRWDDGTSHPEEDGPGSRGFEGGDDDWGFER